MNDLTLGQRIAHHRRRRGLSQVKLAELLDRSESWVSQVECGTRTIDRLSVLGEVARVLDVPANELLPGSFLPNEGDREHPAVRAVRLALSGHPALAVPALYGVGEGAALSALFAATHPERTRALILYAPLVKGTRTDDFPWAMAPQMQGMFLEQVPASWGSEPLAKLQVSMLAPSLADDEGFLQLMARGCAAASARGVPWPGCG